MAAIWGRMGKGASRDLDLIAESLRHRGSRETSWAPTQDVRFGWHQDGAMVMSPEVPLAFTGAILNRRELARRIGLRSIEASALTDAELIWKLYCAEGPYSFAHINGQFSIALYDARTASVVLATDRWSVQPLYLTAIENSWVFASEYRAFLALDQFDARVDPMTVAALQRTKYLPTGKALLANVRPVAPGEFIRLFANGMCEAWPYAQLKLQIDKKQSEATLAAGLRDALLQAAENAIAGYGRIGIALSAGLDSTLTLGAVRAIAPSLEIYTYTASFDPDDPDLALAAEAARHFGTHHREIILAPDDLPRLLPEMVWAMEDPCAREEMLVYHVLAQEAAPEVPIVLYGHMADVLFGGMPRHMLIKLAADLPYARSPIVAFYDYTQTGAMPRSSLGRLLIAAYYRGQHVHPPHVTGDESDGAEMHLRLARHEPLNIALLDAIRHPTEVSAIERLHSRAGVRLASLFHDLEVSRWAFRIPDQLKIRGRCRKYILRRAAESILPPNFAARPKGLIRITQNQRLWHVVDAMAAELLTPRAVAARGLFDPQDVVQLLRAPRNRRHKEERFYRVWTLLLTELWCRTFIDGRGEMCLLTANPYARRSWRPMISGPGAFVPRPTVRANDSRDSVLYSKGAAVSGAGER